jgi:hypothetical protein
MTGSGKGRQNDKKARQRHADDKKLGQGAVDSRFLVGFLSSGWPSVPYVPPPSFRLEENIAAADIQLSTPDLAEIQNAADTVSIQGARYSEEAERATRL